MNDLLFLKGLSTEYTELEQKTDTTFYYTTDDNKLYLGQTELSNPSDLTEKLKQVTTNQEEIKKVQEQLNTLIGEEGSESLDSIINTAIEAAIEEEHTTYVGNKEELATSAKGTLVEAINELDKEIDANKSAGAVTIEEDSVSEEYAKVYTIKQGDVALPTKINIPKDMVVKSAEVVVVTDENAQEYDNKKAGTYIVLTIANNEATRVYIEVGSLVDIYKGATSLEKTKDIIVNVDNVEREISATLKDGVITVEKIANNSITKEKIQENAVTSAAIAAKSITADKLADNLIGTDAIVDESVTKDKLDSLVQGSLDKADSALQESDITVSEKNGAFKVRHKDIDIHGLKDLAYKNEDELNLSQYALAETALVKEDIVEGEGTNGTFTVKGEEVAVHGLKDLAFKNEEDLNLGQYAKTENLGDLASKNQADLKLEEYAKTETLGDLATMNKSDLNLGDYATAENALTKDDITNGETNGTFKVKEKEITIGGLKSLAYMDENELSLTEYAKTSDLGELATMDQSDLNLDQYAKADSIITPEDFTEGTVVGAFDVKGTSVKVHGLEQIGGCTTAYVQMDEPQEAKDGDVWFVVEDGTLDAYRQAVIKMLGGVENIEPGYSVTTEYIDEPTVTTSGEAISAISMPDKWYSASIIEDATKKIITKIACKDGQVQQGTEWRVLIPKGTEKLEEGVTDKDVWMDNGNLRIGMDPTNQISIMSTIFIFLVDHWEIDITIFPLGVDQQACLVEETIINDKPIKDLKIYDLVDTTEGKQPIIKTHSHLMNEIYEIKIDNDKTIKGTWSHRIKTDDGIKEFKELTTDDIVSNHKIEEINLLHLDEAVPVYEIWTQCGNYFVDDLLMYSETKKDLE